MSWRSLTTIVVAAAFGMACKEGDTYIIVQAGGSAGMGAGGLGAAGDDGSGGSSSGSGGSDPSAGGDPGTGGSEPAGGAPAGGAPSGGASNGGTASGGGGQGGGASGNGGSAGVSSGGSINGALFVEDFEDGNYDGWTLGPNEGNATLTVTTSTAAPGSTHSLQISGYTDWYAGLNYMLTGIQPRTVSWWVRAQGALTGSQSLLFSLTQGPTASQELVQVRADQYSMTFAGVPSSLIDYTAPLADHWYHFELELNWQAHTYVAKVDGVVRGETGFIAPIPSIGRVDLFTTVGSPVTYYDDIVMMP